MYHLETGDHDYLVQVQACFVLVGSCPIFLLRFIVPVFTEGSMILLLLYS